jgi:hypothetical protein
MVDALRRAHRVLRPRGRLIDFHPTSAHASVEVAGEITGELDAGDAPRRHAAATEALATIVGEGVFAVDRTLEFPFYTYGDSIDELAEYIAENWQNARIGNDAIARTREALRRARGAKPRVRERVLVTKLRPQRTLGSSLRAPARRRKARARHLC